MEVPIQASQRGHVIHTISRITIDTLHSGLSNGSICPWAHPRDRIEVYLPNGFPVILLLEETSLLQATGARKGTAPERLGHEAK